MLVNLGDGVGVGVGVEVDSGVLVTISVLFEFDEQPARGREARPLRAAKILRRFMVVNSCLITNDPVTHRSDLLSKQLLAYCVACSRILVTGDKTSCDYGKNHCHIAVEYDCCSEQMVERDKSFGEGVQRAPLSK